MRQETRFEDYSPSNKQAGSKQKKVVVSEMVEELYDETEDEVSDNDRSDNDQSDNDSALGSYMKPGLFRPSEKVIDYDDIEL